MEIRIVEEKDKEGFNILATHPMQSWEWGEFRVKTGIEILRLGRFDRNKLLETAQITIHPIPFTSWKIGYMPKGGILSREMLLEIVKLGKKNKLIFVKIEPNLSSDNTDFQLFLQKDKNLICKSPHPLFTRFTFQLDLNKTEEELLKNMHSKTRYNIKVALKHNVLIKEEKSRDAFNSYLKLLMETTKRQKFYAHDEKYHRLMWETLSDAGMAHLFTANLAHEGKNHVLAAWILFLFNNILYYPYGSSSNDYRYVMASNLMMWEAIKFGKKNNAGIFDMWGALSPKHKENDLWTGFHKFKEGYHPSLVELAGSYDIVINPLLYRLYNLAYILRQIILKIKSNISK